jgi:hypothetical protein
MELQSAYCERKEITILNFHDGMQDFASVFLFNFLTYNTTYFVSHIRICSRPLVLVQETSRRNVVNKFYEHFHPYCSSSVVFRIKFCVSYQESNFFATFFFRSDYFKSVTEIEL